MKKIPSLFKRDYADGKPGKHLCYDEITPGCEWVAEGEGTASEKHDGSCCMIRGGKLFKRYDAKHGKTPPPNFEPCEPEADPITGHWPGWVPVGDEPESKWHREGWANSECDQYNLGDDDWTFELVGPKLQGNPHKMEKHLLIPHGAVQFLDGEVPRTFEGLREFFLKSRPMEGIVFKHQDGRMCKVRAGDFGIDWPRKHETTGSTDNRELKNIQ